MKLYQAYNLNIASEIPLPQLVETKGKPDVFINLNKTDEKLEHNGSDRCQGSIPGIGKFLIQNGRKILVNPEPGVEIDRLGIVLTGAVLSVILRQRGFLVIHASCVEINGNAVAFMGASGCGKSTIAATFYTHNYRILSDDIMPIKITPNSAIALPSYPSFKLFPKSLISLGEDTKKLSSVTHKSLKLSYNFTQKFQEKPLNIQKIYVLAKGKQHAIKNLKPQDAFIELVRHTRAINLMDSSESMSKHLSMCSQLIQKVSFCRFTRKPSLTDLPKLVKMVEDDLTQVNTRVLAI
ncbi:phosphoenolpyruvate carboxykinase (ATP) [Mastigocoleus testarum]|uniref:Serine kinase n=1 Tax=Mastigocoleus testarum BC008 TaxID=371196 RepID=A0A0V7ZTQ1_9CYAN|nr:hypothetical protein [Mastigocoleus testarum]KST67761.1 hypothetical protein BC008_44250 [Mastigocoleus testarum BC008]